MTKSSKLDVFLTAFVALYNVAIILLTLLWIFTNVFLEEKGSLSQLEHFDINENVTYGLFFSGALGGAFYCIRAIYQRIGEAFTPVDGGEAKNTLNMRVWFFWYLIRPLQGGVLALIVLSLLNSKLITLENLDSDSLKSYYSLVSLGFLCGFGAHEVIHKIQELIQVVFAKSNMKASNSSQKVKENNGTN